MTMTDCKDCRAALPDLLLEAGYEAAHPELAAHLRACSACGEELADLRGTFAALDEWTAPEPTPYFDTRLMARLREAEQEAPAGFFERLRSWWLYSSGHSVRSYRPALAGAMALVFVLGGATMANFHNTLAGVPSNQPAASAAVNDLKILDTNQQALQQMDQLLDDSQDDSSTTDAPAS